MIQRFSILFLSAFLLMPTGFAVEKKPGNIEAKEISGMSVVGNKDAPKSLYIVPWKTSEIGVETDLASSLLSEDLVPVDKPVFMRELDFYQVTIEK